MSEDKLEKFNNFLSGIDDAFDYFNDLSKLADNNYPVYALVRLCYSLLTASDYLATAHFMNNWKSIHSGKGFINSVLRDKIIYNVHNSKVYNLISHSWVYRRFQKYTVLCVAVCCSQSLG